jgi:hypothetical protein
MAGTTASAAPRTSDRRVTAQRHRWHLPVTWHRRHSIRATLERLDDDPVLLCDCADGEPHTCG